jgi:hypothetical protein
LKERKTKRQINKVVGNGVEYDQTDDTIARLSQRYEKIVGQEFRTQIELDNFLNKYDITLDKAQYSDWVDDEFNEDGIKLATQRAAKKAAPGPTGHAPSLYAFTVYSQKYRVFSPRLSMN